MKKYLDGKRNGKGKEYWKDSNGKREEIIRFKGEYFHGKGKEYYFDGKLMFEGDFLIGKYGT